MGDIRRLYAENETNLFNTCFAYKSLRSLSSRLLDDHATTLDTHEFLRSIALNKILPKIQCLEAQAWLRSEIRAKLGAFLDCNADIEMNAMDINSLYMKLERCKKDRCDGKWFCGGGMRPREAWWNEFCYWVSVTFGSLGWFPVVLIVVMVVFGDDAVRGTGALLGLIVFILSLGE